MSGEAREQRETHTEKKEDRQEQRQTETERQSHEGQQKGRRGTGRYIYGESHRGSPSSPTIQPTPTSPALGYYKAPFRLYSKIPLFAQVSRRRCLDVNLIPAGLC